MKSLTVLAAAFFALSSRAASFDMSPAMLAAARGELAQVSTTVPELRSLNAYGASVLYYAAQSQKDVVATFAFVRERVGDVAFSTLLNQRVTSNGHTVAMEAVFNANEAVIDYLLSLRAAGMKVDFESPTVFGWTPKTFAEREKMPFAIKLPGGSVAVTDRLQWLADQENAWLAALSPEAREFHTQGVELIHAIESFDTPRIIALVASGVRLNERYGRLGATPLNSNARPGMTPETLTQAAGVQALLLNLGANPNLAEGGIMQVPSGFREAVFGYASQLQAMVNHLQQANPARLEAYLDFQGPLNGFTKLMDAAARGRAEVIETLLASGANKAIRAHNGATAYDLAVHYNSMSATPLSQALLNQLQTQ